MLDCGPEPRRCDCPRCPWAGYRLVAPGVRWRGTCMCGGPHPPLSPRAQSARLPGTHGPAPEESTEGSAVGRVPAVPRLCGAGVGGPKPPAPGQVSAGPLASRAFPTETSRAARGWPLLSRLPGSQLPLGAPGACLQVEGPGPHRPDALPTHSLSSRVHPRALVVRGQRLRLRPPWPRARPGGAGVQAAPGVGMRPQLPAASWESGWDEQSAFAAPPPHPNLVGAAGPSPPWLPGPLCPGTGILSAGHRPAACCIRGGGSVKRAASVEAGGPGSAPNPGSPLPTASASLERASRARVGPGRHGPHRSQAVGSSELEPAGSAGKAVGVASESVWLGAGAGLRGAPSAHADLGQAVVWGSHPSMPACARPRGHAGTRRPSPRLSLHGRALGYSLGSVRAEA